MGHHQLRPRYLERGESTPRQHARARARLSQVTYPKMRLEEEVRDRAFCAHPRMRAATVPTVPRAAQSAPPHLGAAFDQGATVTVVGSHKAGTK